MPRTLDEVYSDMHQIVWAIAYRLATTAEQREMDRLHQEVCAIAGSLDAHERLVWVVMPTDKGDKP